MSGVLKRPAPVDIDSAVAAVVRRDGIRIMPDGMAAANRLGLTTAVPAKARYLTDGATRTLKIGGRTVRLRHAGPKVMSWAGKPSAPVVQALLWLGPQAASDARVTATLKRTLPDAVKKDLVRHGAGRHGAGRYGAGRYGADLPGWAAPVVRSLAEPHTGAPRAGASSAASRFPIRTAETCSWRRRSAALRLGPGATADRRGRDQPALTPEPLGRECGAVGESAGVRHPAKASLRPLHAPRSRRIGA